MDISQNKNSLKSSSSATSGGDSGDKGFVIFGPVEIPREKLIGDLIWLHELTRDSNFESAVSMAWHKVSDRAGREKMSQIVHLYRLSQDGKSRPPFLFEKEYQKISGVVSAPKMSLEPR